MDVFLYLVPLTLLIAGIGIIALVYGIHQGHYEDCDRIMNQVITLEEISHKNTSSKIIKDK